MQPKAEPVLIFGTTYNVCPHYPAGTKWEVFQKSRYSQCAWNMTTFAEALAYLRKQYGHAVAATKSPRHAGDEYCEREFRGFIDGPGGRMEWPVIESLVKGGK